MRQNLAALGEAIHHLRTQRGLSLSQVVTAMVGRGAPKIHYSTLEKWEKGQHQPKAGSLISLARALGATAAQEATWLILAGHHEPDGTWVDALPADDPTAWEADVRRGLYRAGFPATEVDTLIVLLDSRRQILWPTGE